MVSADVFAEQRHRMVETQLLARGIRDQAVLTAMRTVPREAFVPPELRAWAYEDMPLPIGDRQTISQPYIVAWMMEALQLSPDDRVLEIGTGSGYAAAVLGCLVKTVYTVERLETRVRHAGQCLQRRQQLLRVTREGETTFRQEAFGVVRFVPLIGAQGWPARKHRRREQGASSPPRSPARALREASCDATHIATSGCV